MTDSVEDKAKLKELQTRLDAVEAALYDRLKRIRGDVITNLDNGTISGHNAAMALDEIETAKEDFKQGDMLGALHALLMAFFFFHLGNR